MIYATYMFGVSGVGNIITINKRKSESKSDPNLICGFLTAIRSFSHEIYEELKRLEFVESQMAILPSHDLYVLVVHASNEYTKGELLHYLELIRDYINEKYWDEMRDEKGLFFTTVSLWRKSLENQVKKVIKERKWMKC